HIPNSGSCDESGRSCKSLRCGDWQGAASVIFRPGVDPYSGSPSIIGEICMTNLRSRNYLFASKSVRGLAKLAGVSGDVSLRELMELLGPAEFAPRPVYVLGHNTNSHAEVIEAFEAGANGLEIDITPYAMRPDELCVAHRGGAGNGYGVEEDPPLVSFLQFLREQAEARGSQFALLMLDVKPYATKPEHGKLMLEAVRDHLIDEANPINLIISTARFDYRSLFQKIAPMLRP